MHIDHQNHTYTKLNLQQVLRWHLFIEEFQPQFQYIKGTKSTLTDALSRLPRSVGQIVATSPHQPKLLSDSIKSSPSDDDTFTASEFLILLNDQDILKCFLNYPAVDTEHPFALDFDTITKAQNEDAALITTKPCKQNKFRQISDEQRYKSYFLHSRS